MAARKKTDKAAAPGSASKSKRKAPPVPSLARLRANPRRGGRGR